ncbi:MAG: hypothetical protein OEY22_06860 [Candidatus Bathyarchaeota archaeon]|nr:hypothetical protein [Candidatus Bathyarchaeota archaeon]
MVEVAVNWEDSALKRWLDPITRNSTKYGYKTAFKAYAYSASFFNHLIIWQAFYLSPQILRLIFRFQRCGSDQ